MISSNFLSNVLKRIDKLDQDNVKELLVNLGDERSFLMAIFDSMIEGVLVLDETNKVTYVNRPLEKMMAIRGDHLIEKDIKEIMKNHDMIAAFTRMLSDGLSVKDEEFSTQNPFKATYRINFLPLIKNKNIIGNIFMIQDITREKEEKLRLHQAESLASLSTLAAGVAHEIKNPLGSIDIHIQLIHRILTKIKFENKEEILSLLQIVKDEIERLNNIVKDFLFTVRPVHFDLNLESLNDIVQSVVDSLHLLAEMKGIDLQPLDSTYDGKILCDSRYLKVAFFNLIQNAIDACASGDMITVTIKEEGEKILVIIRDTGSGIGPGQMSKLFEPYFSTKENGTGLGLSIVYKVITEHHGKCLVDSELGEWTTFTIELPKDFQRYKRLTSNHAEAKNISIE